MAAESELDYHDELHRGKRRKTDESSEVVTAFEHPQEEGEERRKRSQERENELREKLLGHCRDFDPDSISTLWKESETFFRDGTFPFLF